MRFRLVNTIEESLSEDVVQGDIVFLRKDFPYKSEQTKQLVDGNHQFLVLSSDTNKVLVLMTTSKTEKSDKFSNAYVKAKGDRKEFLIELDTWGTFTKDYVYRVAEHISQDTVDEVVDKFSEPGRKTDLKLESRNRRKK